MSSSVELALKRNITDVEFDQVKQWLEYAGEGPPCLIEVPIQKRMDIVELWLKKTHDLGEIAATVGVDENAVAAVLGSNPIVREVEDSRHRARLYAFRHELDQLHSMVVARLKDLMESDKSKDWDRALTQIRRYIQYVDMALQDQPLDKVDYFAAILQESMT